MFKFIKNRVRLSLPDPKLLVFLGEMIGGSEISKEVLVSERKPAAWVGRGCRWGALLFSLAVAMVFGGVGGHWFDARHADGGLLFRILQLSAGSLAMGAVLSIPGSLFFGRNPVRWGMGMPVLVYLAGVLIALSTGRAGVSGLVYGAPLLMGLSIAAGTMGAFLVDGAFGRQETAGRC